MGFHDRGFQEKSHDCVRPYFSLLLSPQDKPRAFVCSLRLSLSLKNRIRKLKQNKGLISKELDFLEIPVSEARLSLLLFSWFWNSEAILTVLERLRLSFLSASVSGEGIRFRRSVFLLLQPDR